MVNFFQMRGHNHFFESKTGLLCNRPNKLETGQGEKKDSCLNIRLLTLIWLC